MYGRIGVFLLFAFLKKICLDLDLGGFFLLDGFFMDVCGLMRCIDGVKS